MSRRMLKIVGFAIYNVLVYNKDMTHRDIITITKFKTMGFHDIEMKYIPEIKLNRITCKHTQKVGRTVYEIPFECFANPASKLIISRHLLFEQVVLALDAFNESEHVEKVAYLESVGLK